MNNRAKAQAMEALREHGEDCAFFLAIALPGGAQVWGTIGNDEETITFLDSVVEHARAALPRPAAEPA